jgi:hypothetical protein
MSLDRPRQIPGTLNTCQEKDEINARTNRKGKGRSSWNEGLHFTLQLKIRNKEGLGRTKTATKTVLEALPYIMDLNGRFTTIPPNHLACFAKALLVVSEDDEIVKGCHGIAPQGMAGTTGLLRAEAWFPPLVCAWQWGWGCGGGHGQGIFNKLG